MVKVSVIIPVYGVEAFLERAVDSALAQTLEEKEIILVDDGSPDGCPAICDRYAREYPGLVRVLHQENQGLGMARNAGAAMARGEYLAFLDSDDTVEPEMYQALYEKAVSGGYDMVMCDVHILYVDEGRETVVKSYPREEVDLGDYIATGNNITYSVNKLFRRSIWQEHRYERMLFEDIALIPALVTRCRSLGYVPQAFYNYYRRGGTISTTQTGAMVDLVRAFRSFLTQCDPAYKEEAVYTTARQLLWNMTQSRPLFLPDFIGLLREFEADFRLNPYLKKDKKTAKVLEYLDRPVIPERLICAHCRRELPQALLQRIREDFPQGELVEPGESWLSREDLPPCVREAASLEKWQFVEEYLCLLALWEGGGVVLAPEAVPQLNLKRRRMEGCFFGFETREELTDLCFGALPHHYVIRALLDSYREDRIYNRAFLPLTHRLRDFLITRFGLRMNGHRQLLEGVTVHLPSVLAYDLQDGENCCKRGLPAPEGYEVVRREVLAQWSERILENWNLYKQERDRKPPAGKGGTAPAPGKEWFTREQLEAEGCRVAQLYESSTSWKVTRPLRAAAKLWKR
ncbi:MAG: glycosyltransferase family 2 protein [Acutalibacter sp.]|jgi:glycosyltransferase involved in cell wall biosynthesis